MVEFAIITPLLFAILFAIIDFSIAYNDANSVRQGVRDAARQGVVGDIPSTTGCSLHSSTGNSTTNSLICIVKNRIGLTNANTYVNIQFADTNASPTTYQDSNYVADGNHALLVCAQYPLTSTTGLYTSLLSGKWIQEKVAMNIENLYSGSPQPNQGFETGTGISWGWCTL